MRSSGGGWKPILEIDGVVVPAGTGLTRTSRGWAHPTPVFCHNGHRLTPSQTVVGFRHCRASHVDGGHRSFLCRTCGDTVLLPLPGPDCDHRDFDERPTGTTRPPAASE